MELELTPEQTAARMRARSFVAQHVAPRAAEVDGQEGVPADLIAAVAREGYLGAALVGMAPSAAPDHVTAGLIAEEFGRGCSSTRSMLTVQGMVGRAVGKWGSQEQRACLPEQLATGGRIAAFALTEPGSGSDAAAMETRAEATTNGYVLNGRKSWISFGQTADVILVIARLHDGHAALLVDAGTPGLTVEPVSGLLGLRGTLVAELVFADCAVPLTTLVGRPGTGWSHVAAYALDEGRFSVAWGCVGIARAALEASLRHASERHQFGVALREHQLVRQMLTDMAVSVEAARLLCHRAARSRDRRSRRALMETSMAKYFASTAAVKAAADAVQIHGASGTGRWAEVQRLHRDATIMTIIEGSSQMHQITIAEQLYQDNRPALDAETRPAPVVERSEA